MSTGCQARWRFSAAAWSYLSIFAVILARQEWNACLVCVGSALDPVRDIIINGGSLV